MASNIFNIYTGGNGSYTTTYNKIKTLTNDTPYSLIFDKSRHSIWTQGEEYGYGFKGLSSSGSGDLVTNITSSEGIVTISYISSSTLSVSSADDANTLDGTSKGDLLTDASLSVDSSDSNKTKVSVTVGGTTKSGSLTVPYASNAGKLGNNNPSYYAHEIELTGDVTGTSSITNSKLSVSTTHYVPSTATATTGTGATSFIASNGFNDANAHYLRDGISILNGLKLDAKKHVVGTYEVIIKETYPTELTNANVASNNEFGRKITLTTNYNDSYSTVIPFATNTSAGVLKTYSAALSSAPETYLTTTEGRYYASRLNSDNKLITNVPWENFWTYKAAVSNNSGSKLTFTYHKYVGSSYADSTFDVTIPIASSTNFGVVKPGTSSGRNYGVSVNSSTGAMTVNVPWEDLDTSISDVSFDNSEGPCVLTINQQLYTNPSSLVLESEEPDNYEATVPTMTSTCFGVAKLGDSTQRDISASKVYGIAKNSSGQLCVNVPWTDESVTGVTTHYIPTTDANSALSVDASGGSDATFGTTQLVTGVNLSRDAAGHVTGVTVDSIKLPSLTSTYPTIETKNTNQSYNFLFTDKTSGSLAKSYVNTGLTFNPSENTLSFSGGGLISTGDYHGNINGDDDILYLEGGANGINIYGNSAPIDIKTDDYPISIDSGGDAIYLYSSDINLYSPFIEFKTTNSNLYPQGVSSGSHYENNIIKISNNGIYQRVYFTGTSTYGNLFEVSYTGALKFKRLSQAVNPNLSTSYAVGHGTESNYIDQITVASSPGSDTHTLYVVI